MSNKYLFNEEPKSFSPTIAKALGSISKAVIMQQVHFWLHVYSKKSDQRHFFDGHYWVFNSYGEWHKDLDFIPFATMKRQILELERDDLLISSEFNKNRGDRTKWYRINYEQLTLLTTGIELSRLVQNEPPSDHFEPPSDHFEPPSDHFEPPSDHFDPLYIQSDHQSDPLIDQQKKERDFFENSPLEQKKENLSDSGKPKDPKTPPLPPLTAARNYAQEMSDRFSPDFNRFAPRGLSQQGFLEWHLGGKRNDWHLDLIAVAKAHLKKHEKPSGDGDAINFINNICKIEDWAKFELLADQAKLRQQDQSQARSQQQQSVNPVSQEPTVYAVPDFVKQFAAKKQAS